MEASVSFKLLTFVNFRFGVVSLLFLMLNLSGTVKNKLEIMTT